MPNPTSSEVHIDALQTQVSQATPVQSEKLIAAKILSVIMVKKITDLITIFGDEHLRRGDDLYVPGTDAKTFDWTVTSEEAYRLRPHALATKIIWNDRDNADEPIKYEQTCTEMTRDNQLVIYEGAVATKLSTASNYTSTDPAVAIWSDFNNSDPLADMDAGKVKIHELVGFDPNIMEIPYRVYNLLRRHPKLLHFYQGVEGGRLTMQHLKDLFEIETILIGDQRELTSKEGQAVKTFANLWNETMVSLFYVAKTPAPKQMSYGYTYRKVENPFADRWTEQSKKCDWLRINDEYDWKIQSKDCGFLLTGVL